ncbi:MAG: metal-sulfur cluster assembly factor [Chlorobi bacterium]|nr:metal-sulfur cluster assembly factor [Chlorobiota bacterium]
MEEFNEKLKNEGIIYNLLKNVIDPEVGVNIVDMGLVYEIDYAESEKTIHIKMTLSSPGCPLGDVIIQDVKATIAGTYKNFEPIVELVWEPTWSPDMMTKEGKEALGY